MEKSKAPTKLTRRNFLLAGIASGAAGVAAIAGKTAPETKGVSASERSDDHQGYQLSEHVRSYYRTTQV